MKTNFTVTRHLVLTDSDDKIMAIIHCPTGLQDITEKLETAIREDRVLDELNISVDEFQMEEFMTDADFTARLNDGDESFMETFYLTGAEVY